MPPKWNASDSKAPWKWVILQGECLSSLRSWTSGCTWENGLVGIFWLGCTAASVCTFPGRRQKSRALREEPEYGITYLTSHQAPSRYKAQPRKACCFARFPRQRKQQRWFCNSHCDKKRNGTCSFFNLAESELTFPLLAWSMVRQLLCLSAWVEVWCYASFLMRQFHLCNRVVFNNMVKVLQPWLLLFLAVVKTLHLVQCFKRQLEKTFKTLRPSAGDAHSHCVLKPVH